jgi:curli biogenesis system outer membrane secretion channel CsgG|tara:strand:+ start:597 stop:1499 length:903 start_codon:yes stop_codon:yes gene_type:complete
VKILSSFLLSAIVALSLIADSAIAQDETNLTLKRKIAISRFSNETQSGNSFLVSNNGDRIGKQASDILSAKLSESQKFLIFERLDSGGLSAEKILAGLKEDGIAVDYLIVGSVTEFGRSTESDTGVFSRAKIQKAFAKVAVRLVEVSTGRIIHSEEGAGEALITTKKTMGVGSSAGFDQSLTDKAISAAIGKVVSNLVENMTGKPWRSYLLTDEGEGSYILAGGASQGITTGTEFVVIKRGRKIKNPQTGAVIELPGKKVATVEVVMTLGEDELSEVSYVTLTSGSVDGAALDDYHVTTN